MTPQPTPALLKHATPPKTFSAMQSAFRTPQYIPKPLPPQKSKPHPNTPKPSSSKVKKPTIGISETQVNKSGSSMSRKRGRPDSVEKRRIESNDDNAVIHTETSSTVEQGKTQNYI